MLRRALLAGLFVALVRPAWAEPPEIKRIVPGAAIPGRAVKITFYGQRLAHPTGLWTSFPAKVQLVGADSGSETSPDEVTYQITIPRQVDAGIGALRVITRDGASNLRLVMLDDLPSTPSNGANHHHDAAQSLTLPLAVDGTASSLGGDFYQFSGSAGQRLSVEVVAQRLGSALDPSLRLLDSAGNELAYSDDEPGIGADSRIAYTLPFDGQYVLEVKDIRFRGGDGYHYRLRLGSFPLATTAFPLGGRSGTIATFHVYGPQVDSVGPISVALPRVDSPKTISLGVRLPQSPGSSWVSVVADQQSETIESEPNDDADVARPLVVPCVVSGRFCRAGDRDCFRFQTEGAERFVFQGRTRSLGSPADLFMQLCNMDGSVIAEVDDSPAGEGVIDHTFSKAGVYLLVLEELTRQGGPEYGYRINIERFQPGFSLAVDREKFDVPHRGTLVANVKAVRRDYAGPITLQVRGAGDDLVLENHVIAQEEDQTDLEVTLPDRLAVGQYCTVELVGRAKIGDADFEATASTLGPLRSSLSHNPIPPSWLDGVITLAVGPALPPFFELALESVPVYFPTVVGSSRFKVKLKRLDRQFQSAISLAVDGLPHGLAWTVEPVGKGEAEYWVTLSGSDSLPLSAHMIRIVGEGTFRNQTKQVVLDQVPLRICPPLLVEVVAAGPLVQGDTQTAVVRVRRFGKQSAPVTIQWTGGPEGVLAPVRVVIPAEASELELPLVAAPDAPVGRFSSLTVLAKTTVDERPIQVESLPASIQIEPRRTASPE